MKSIYFATGNKGKIATLKRHFKQHGVDISIKQGLVDIIEPQADTAIEVAIAKARQAYDILKCPVIVDDSSFHISVLGGFPGPYIKYMLSTIGVDGILNFLKNHDDRSAYFLSSLVYIDADGKEHVFEDEPYRGVIADQIVNVDHKDAWSDLYKIFIPNGSNNVLAELTDEERLTLKTTGDSYAAFSQWIKKVKN